MNSLASRLMRRYKICREEAGLIGSSEYLLFLDNPDFPVYPELESFFEIGFCILWQEWYILFCRVACFGTCAAGTL